MQRILNYGSFFQSYSLKRILESLGHEVFFVDYKVDWTIETIQRYKNAKLSYLRMAKRMLFHPYDYGKQRKNALYALFSPCYKLLDLTPEYHFRRKVDVLVVGSDEVFNCLQKNEDVGYSLELFGKNNRAEKLISYAASFGDTTIQKLKQFNVEKEVSYYLNRFDALSVRDQNSSEIVQQLCGRIPHQHFDPVLIGDLEEIEWAKCEYDHFMIVYGYSRRFTQEEGDAIMDFARAGNLKLIILNAQQSFGDLFIRCRPDEILGYFAKADYVVTDTFHGMIFAIIMNKPFLVLEREDKGHWAKYSDRMTSTLDNLGLL